MTRTYGKSEESTTERVVTKKCYLLFLPREIRDKIWNILFLRDCALQPSPGKKREGYQVPIRNSDEIFSPELFIVLDLCACQSATALSKEQDKNPETNKVFGVEVLRTCKQVCEEGVGVLYGKNTFKFNISRHHKYIKHFRKWLCLNKVKGGSMMWSMETLLEVGQTFDPLEQPETISIKTFVQKIGKKNAGRMTAIHFEVFLAPFDYHTRNLVQRNDDEDFITNHDLIFKYTLTDPTEIRIAGYWDDSLGNRALSVKRDWKKSSNYRMYLRTPGVCSSMQLFCKVSKIIETFVKRVPKDTSTQLTTNLPNMPSRCSGRIL